MRQLVGNAGIGHVRYPTAGCDGADEAQPFYVNAPFGIGLGHNGNLTNVEEVRQELRPYLIRPIEKLGDEEAYTVFCINGPLTAGDEGVVAAEQWLRANRRDVAALLTEEPDPAQLSEQEAEESTGKYYSYYERDLVVLDWDAALIIDEPQDFDEVLYIMELANLQLAELEAYDGILDRAVDRSYRDLGGSSRFRGATNQMVVVLRRLCRGIINTTTSNFRRWQAGRKIWCGRTFTLTNSLTTHSMTRIIPVLAAFHAPSPSRRMPCRDGARPRAWCL